MSTSKPGFGDAHNTDAPNGENDTEVLPPTRWNVSVWLGAAVVVVVVVVVAVVVVVVVEAVVVGATVVVACAVDVVACAVDVVAAAVEVVAVLVVGATVGSALVVDSAFVVEVGAALVVSARVGAELAVEIAAPPTGVVVGPDVLGPSATVVEEAQSSAFSRRARVFAGAGFTSSLSTTATPAQATATATPQPRSHNATYASGLITSTVCALWELPILKPALKES